jgi:hypothetical protein
MNSNIITTNEMILELRAMQKQIIHGTDFFGKTADRIEELQELLRSAHAIADRKGEETHWERFAAGIAKVGIGPVTARTYRILPSDRRDIYWFTLNDMSYVQHTPILGANVRAQLPSNCSNYSLALIRDNITSHYVDDLEGIESGSELWAIPPCGFSK